MGHTVEAICMDCDATTTVEHGGGFTFHLLRCNQCGENKTIDFDELGELHIRYLRGLSVPYCMATAEHDKYIQEHVQVEPISEEKYHSGVADLAGKCTCGGKYTFAAPPRCSKCHSTQLEEGEPDMFYD